jgi:hypothetical protein
MESTIALVYDSLGDHALRWDLCFASEEGLQLWDGGVIDGFWDVLGSNLI